MKDNMHHGASPTIFYRASILRKYQTEAELLLWNRLRNNQLGYKFRRQHPISNYVVDFYCHHFKLVIELDGSIHSIPGMPERDRIKDENLELLELNILRFTNEEVVNSIEVVIEKIKTEMALIENTR